MSIRGKKHETHSLSVETDLKGGKYITSEEQHLQSESFALFFNTQICHKGRRPQVSMAAVQSGEVERTAGNPCNEKLKKLKHRQQSRWSRKERTHRKE